MDKWRGKVAIVTGASAGIGAAVVQALVHHGMVVVGLARRTEKIEEMSAALSKAGEKGKLVGIKTDLRKEGDILSAFQWVEKELGGPDVLVNNAGITYLGDFQDGVIEEWRAMLDVNILAVCICMREFLKSTTNRGKQNGHIINISSVAGHVPSHTFAVYSGTKFALTAISQSLRRELAQKGSTIKVTNVSPGLTWSETTTKNLGDAGMEMMAASDVAQAIVDVLSATAVTQVCEVVLTPVPTIEYIY
uniref:Uncharacterized protein n=1 Tax=Homalodisca liturata TaxID=320908 RepID=A0A1B6IS58_9HEMI